MQGIIPWSSLVLSSVSIKGAWTDLLTLKCGVLRSWNLEISIHYLENLKITLLHQIPFLLYSTSIKTFPLLSSFSHLIQWSIKHLLKSDFVNISTWGQELYYIKFTFSLLNDIHHNDLIKKSVQTIHMLFMYILFSMCSDILY